MQCYFLKSIEQFNKNKLHTLKLVKYASCLTVLRAPDFLDWRL